MALKKSDPAAEHAGEVFSKMNERVKEEKEKLKTVSFQIKPSDYRELKKIFDELGLSTGSGLRFALTEFLRKYKK